MKVPTLHEHMVTKELFLSNFLFLSSETSV